MASQRFLNRLPHRIQGASAIEFVLVFPLLFAIIYGTLAYGYVYFLQQRINFIAQEAVRAAIAVAPGSNPGAYQAAAQAQADLAILNNFTLGGGSGTIPAALTSAFVINPATNTLTVTLTYSLTTPTLFPKLVLPLGIGEIPPLPPALVATAAGRLS